MTNSVPDQRRPGQRRKSVFTISGLLVPLFVVGVGILIGIEGPHPESDWFGASVLAPIGFALIAASLLAIICSVAAFVRQERAAFLSAITAVPGLILLVWLVGSILHI